jgi:hypothetical protein
MIQDVASIAWGNYEWSAGGCTLMKKNKTHFISCKGISRINRSRSGAERLGFPARVGAKTQRRVF